MTSTGSSQHRDLLLAALYLPVMTLQCSHTRCGNVDGHRSCCARAPAPSPFGAAVSVWESRSNKRRRLNYSVSDNPSRGAQSLSAWQKLRSGTPACLQTGAVTADLEPATEADGEWEISWPGQEWEDEEVCHFCSLLWVVLRCSLWWFSQSNCANSHLPNIHSTEI